VLVHALAFFGPIIVAIGTVLLAYELLKAPVRHASEELYNSAVTGLETTRQELAARYRGMSPPYPPEEVEQFIGKMNETFDGLLASTNQKREGERAAHRDHVLRYALLGLFLVLLGSGMQAVVPLLGPEPGSASSLSGDKALQPPASETAPQNAMEGDTMR
jgi:hypothetical protein